MDVAHVQAWIVPAPDAALVTWSESLLTPEEDGWITEQFHLGPGGSISAARVCYDRGQDAFDRGADADEGCHLRWSPSRSVTMLRWVWLSAVSFIGAAPRWRLSWVVQALSTLSEPLGAAATI